MGIDENDIYDSLLLFLAHNFWFYRILLYTQLIFNECDDFLGMIKFKSFYLVQHEEISWATVVEVSKENINSISNRVTCRLCNIPLCSIFNL